MNKIKLIIIVVSLFLISFLSYQNSLAYENTELSNGQTVYIPAYSHIYVGNKERPFLLTVTLSIRNINFKNSIKIVLTDYYETQGQLIKKYITKPITLKPLESLRFVIPEEDKVGGSGANFIVKWQADKSVNPPIIESIMIGTTSQQGISFASRGRVVDFEK